MRRECWEVEDYLNNYGILWEPVLCYLTSIDGEIGTLAPFAKVIKVG